LRSATVSRGGGRVRVWTGGKVVAEANRLRQLWLDPQSTEAELARATEHLLGSAFRAERTREPSWLDWALHELRAGGVTSTACLAQRLGMHPGWLAQAYRAAVGEGVGQTLQRHRVVQAARLLRTTDLTAAAVAAEVGFCDQSHMIRAFTRLLGRGPARVRAERRQLVRSG